MHWLTAIGVISKAFENGVNLVDVLGPIENMRKNTEEMKAMQRRASQLLERGACTSGGDYTPMPRSEHMG